MATAQPKVAKPWKRNRIIAEILAVFFGPWSWLYTFRKDHWKFIVSLPAICLVYSILLLSFIDPLIGKGSVFPQGEDAFTIILLFFFYFVPFYLVFWIWAIIDVLWRKPQWYTE